MDFQKKWANTSCQTPMIIANVYSSIAVTKKLREQQAILQLGPWRARFKPILILSWLQLRCVLHLGTACKLARGIDYKVLMQCIFLLELNVGPQSPKISISWRISPPACKDGRYKSQWLCKVGRVSSDSLLCREIGGKIIPYLPQYGNGKILHMYTSLMGNITEGAVPTCN